MNLIELKVKQAKTKLILKFALPSIAVIVLVFFFGLIVVGFVANEEDNQSNASNSTTCNDSNDLPVAITDNKGMVTKAMDMYAIPEDYVDLLLAQLYQESGANENVLNRDPWQSSESYCGSIGCITNPLLSTSQAMKVHSENKELATKLNIKGNKENAVLQAYNFGSGFLVWLDKNNFEYSLETAYDYSVYMSNKHPEYKKVCNLDPKKKACYGDYKYVSNVRAKLGCSSIATINSNEVYLPYYAGTFVYTAMYGGYPGHVGTDLVNISNDKSVYSIAQGQVVFINTGCSIGYLGNLCGNGFGNHVIIQHKIEGVNYYSLYGHLSKVRVNVGDEITPSSVIGIQGNTGNSSGEHLHLELRARANSINNAFNGIEHLNERVK